MKTKRSHAVVCTAFALSLVLSLAAAFMISCGGSTTPTSATTGTVNVSLSDPLTCGNQFPHIYLTVTKVTANINAGAGPNDSSWQPLLDLTSAPVQVDLSALNPTNACVLKMLGSSGPLPPGKYQQIRLYLLSNNPGAGVQTPNPSTNSCGQDGSNGWNCADTGSGIVELQLPSEVQTGLKIPSSHITNGGLTVMAGQSVDLDVDIQSCASIVHQGNNRYLLKPVVFASEVSTDMKSITGQVVVGDASGQPVLDSSGQPTPIAGATVLFEQQSGGDESILDSTTTDANGNFFVCPLPADGPYDIVVTAQTGTLGTSATTYNPTVAFSVPLGANLGQVPLVPEMASTAATGGAATVAGQVDTEATAEDVVTLTPTMSISSTNVIIPVFSVNGLVATAQPPSVSTTSSPGTPPCTTGVTDCYNYNLTVPASNPNVGTYSNGAITYGGPASGDIIYSLTAASAGCTTTGTDTQTTPSPGVMADGTVTLPDLKLTGCN